MRNRQVLAAPPGSTNMACAYRGSSGTREIRYCPGSKVTVLGTPTRNVPGSRDCFAEVTRKPITGNTNESAKSNRYWGPIAKVKKPKKQIGSLSRS